MTTTISCGAWLEQARHQLAPGHEHPTLEAHALLSEVLSRPKAWVLAHPEYLLEDVQIQCLNAQLARLAGGEPLPYLLGHWEFYGIDFILSPDVLIPRPETELLVEEAIQWAHARPHSLKAVDVGTGSGCIAISLARHSSNLHMLATDISRPALRIARQNVDRQVVQGQISLLQADLLSACAGPFDLLCANLPYIPSKTLAGLEVGLHEPGLALDGGTDGLRLVERLLAQAVSCMAPGGMLLLEIESSLDAAAIGIAHHYYPKAKVEIGHDLAGKPRLLKINLIG